MAHDGGGCEARSPGCGGEPDGDVAAVAAHVGGRCGDECGDAGELPADETEAAAAFLGGLLPRAFLEFSADLFQALGERVEFRF